MKICSRCQSYELLCANGTFLDSPRFDLASALLGLHFLLPPLDERTRSICKFSIRVTIEISLQYRWIVTVLDDTPEVRLDLNLQWNNGCWRCEIKLLPECRMLPWNLF